MSNSYKIRQDLTYFLIGLDKQLKYAEGNEQSPNHVAKMMAKSHAAALKMAISGIRNILKKEERRVEREEKRNPHRKGTEPLTAKMAKKYSQIR